MTTAPQRFPAAMRAIHWATAAAMIAVVVLAWVIPEGPGNGGVLLMLHKSIGLGILALTAVRLALRRLSRLPEDDAGQPWIEAAAARAVHVLLYGILIVLPVSGYLSVAARGKAVSVFGLFDIPALVPVSPALHNITWTVHETGQLAVYVVIGLHVAASLYHLVVRRDGVMARMWPAAGRFTLPAPARPAAE